MRTVRSTVSLNFNDLQLRRFDTLPIGTPFLFCNILLLKVRTAHNLNAIQIGSGETLLLADSSMVYLVDAVARVDRIL